MNVKRGLLSYSQNLALGPNLMCIWK